MRASSSTRNHGIGIVLFLAIGGLTYFAGLLTGRQLNLPRIEPYIAKTSTQGNTATASAAPFAQGAEEASANPPSETTRRVTVAELSSFLQNYDGMSPDYIFEVKPMLFSVPVADYPEVWQLSRHLPSPELRDQLKDSLIYLWSKKDPAGAIAAFGSRLEGNDWENARNTALLFWGAKDPDAALAWISRVDSKAERLNDMAWTITGLAELDVRRASQLLNDFPSGTLKKWAAATVAEHLARVDPDAALELVKDCDEIRKGMVIDIVAGERAERDLRGSLEWAEQIGDPETKAAALGSIVQKGTATDPHQMAAFAEAQTDSKLRKDLLGRVAAQWAEDDLPSAVAWAKALPDPASRQIAWDVVSVRLDLPAAASFISSEPGSPEEKLQKLESLGHHLAFKEADQLVAGISWIAQLPAEPERDAMITGLTHQLSTSAVTELALSIQDPRLLEKSAVNIAMNLSRSYPEGASDWLIRLPDCPARTSAAEELARSWGRMYPRTAFDWVSSLQDSELRAKAAEAFFSATIGSRNDLATRSLALVGDQERVADLVSKATRKWSKVDPEAAAAWLKSFPKDSAGQPE